MPAGGEVKQMYLRVLSVRQACSDAPPTYAEARTRARPLSHFSGDLCVNWSLECLLYCSLLAEAGQIAATVPLRAYHQLLPARRRIAMRQEWRVTRLFKTSRMNEHISDCVRLACHSRTPLKQLTRFAKCVRTRTRMECVTESRRPSWQPSLRLDYRRMPTHCCRYFA